MQHAEDGLEEENDEYNDADDGVSLGELELYQQSDEVQDGNTNILFIFGDSDAQTKGYDVDNVSKDLERSMEPDHASERCETDSNGTGREEDDESERGENTVGDQHLLRITSAARTNCCEAGV